MNNTNPTFRLAGPLRGFTLMELLISMAIFTVLGMALAMFMTSSVESFRLNTARKQSWSTASAVLGQLELHLTHAWLAPGDRNPDVDVKFIGTREANGCTKLVFVATSSNPDTNSSDRGIREVAWYIEPGATFPYKICRSERLAVGGDQSLFSDGGGDNANTRVFATGIGYFGISYIPDVSSLSDEDVDLDQTILTEGYMVWDSTSGIESSFPLKVENSADNPWDDILPGRLVITLTVMPVSGMRSFLVEALDGNGTMARVSDTQGFPPPNSKIESFLRIDDEWMEYTSVTEDSFGVVMRGARGTVPAPHAEAAMVRAGYSFTRTISVPCGGIAIR